ncbi:uncharacterized protein LY89DRAFT_741446 [Mollisia scopiformis]|uniref:EDC4-like protein pdc1 beta-propeller domain-containing protein n=1 Tax=Mollisia scopiformis TaxID=149040 RepID=A0A132B9R6_MOLSC|nr:uncharacterized protein LY89DRAFT_741446 [Mollisia scopiformis]KUJ09150.1 hypothetical protein LY89DRAFT_741446 [Mollisia scopiformis]
MSGSSGYPAANNGEQLDSLFAQLRNQQTSKPPNLEPSYTYYNNNTNNNGYFQPASSQQHHDYHQASVTSAIPTPSEAGSQPHHSSAIMSPADTPQFRSSPAASRPPNNDGASNLLNLLKFSQPSAASSSQQGPIGPPSTNVSRAAPASFSGSDILRQVGTANHDDSRSSDLLATLLGQNKSQTTRQFAKPSEPPQSSFAAASSPPEQTQAYLLQLLKPKPPQSDEEPQIKHTKILTPPSKAVSEDDVGEVTQAMEDASLEMNMMGSAATENIPGFGKENVQDTTPKSSQGMFTYVNPFEQLAASSPRHRTPKNSTAAPAPAGSPIFQILKNPRQDSSSDHKRKVEERSSMPSPAHTKRKIEPVSQASSDPPTPLPDGRTQVEALIGIGASETKESVQDAIDVVGDQVDRQVQEAIARAEQDEVQVTIEKDIEDMLDSKTEQEFKEAAQVTAEVIKNELDKEENSGALDDLPTPLAEEVKDIIEDVAQGHIADSWESADNEDSPVKDEEETMIKVYNFPMRPWTSITVKQHGERRPSFSDDSFVDIARLKKEFDQIDRILVTASNNFIVYGMSKNGGLRIIRQEDGTDTKLFTETHDRIFSVVVSASSAEQKEAIIGTGISGTVYWALIKDGEGDHIEDSNPETHAFALPPIHSQETESPGGVLKTRARKSASHPDFFAVGRGKFINIIWPGVILKQSYLKNGKDRIVDTDRYLAKHSLKVNTGKAGKDFTFSEDDTTIVSLDKAGRVKFWDVRDLTAAHIMDKPSESQNIEIKEPLITFTTTPATEKSWPTSVMFVDKLRPFQRGGALRYLVVGMKQNHTLQLWDLALGKPVQEIHLPHSKESDAVCSVVYHAATGMIVVGHPTRNSIYFLHLSAPKYTLPKNLNQAEYMQRLVANDPDFKKPDSTAVMSGMREYSFENKGQLRSLDILQTPNSANSSAEPPRTLFELYVMHSKGVTCLNVKPATLGWTSDNKVIYPVVADKVNMVTIDTLKEIPATIEASEPSNQVSMPTRIVPRPATKETSREPPKKSGHSEPAASTSKVEDKPEKKDLAISNGGMAQTSGPEKAEKKKRRKGTQNSEHAAAGPSHIGQPSKPIVLDPSSNVRNGNLNKAPVIVPQYELATASAPAREINDDTLKEIEARVSGEVKKLFGDSLETLYRNIKEDRRTQIAVADAKQDAMLRLVSSTLSDNIEATLGQIVNKGIQQSVLPAISDVVSKAVAEQLGSRLNAHIAQVLPKELKVALPDIVTHALNQPQLQKIFGESVAKNMAFRVDEQLKTMLSTVVVPSFQNMAMSLVNDVQRQATEQIQAIEQQRHTDSIKIEQLTQLVAGLTNSITSMAQSQSDFQAEFLKLKAQSVSDRRQGSQTQAEASRVSRTSTSLTGPIDEKTPAEIEYENMLAGITTDMSTGDYESAVIKWLQTKREQEFFAAYFSKFSPDFVRELTPLLLLSLGATISIKLDDQLMNERIAWMETLLSAFQTHVSNGTIDDQVRELIPKIMGIYTQRVEHLFMRISQIAAKDPALKRLSQIVTSANRILETARPYDYNEELPAELAYPPHASGSGRRAM